jgi:hypothetical protein
MRVAGTAVQVPVAAGHDPRRNQMKIEIIAAALLAAGALAAAAAPGLAQNAPNGVMDNAITMASSVMTPACPKGEARSKPTGECKASESPESSAMTVPEMPKAPEMPQLPAAPGM